MHSLTEWRLRAPLPAVWAAMAAPEGWPAWWPGLAGVETLEPGDALGVGAVRRFTWRGRLPYSLGFVMRTTALVPLERVEGQARGDLEGVGCWTFSLQNGLTVVRYRWVARLTPLRLRVLEAVAGPLLAWNHDQVMIAGGRGLAASLGAPLEGLRCERLDKGAWPGTTGRD